LSLVELLVALGVGLLLTAAVSQIFLSSRQTERLQDAMSQVQDNGRFALDLIVSDLQQVGYMACNTPWYFSEIDLSTDSSTSQDQAGTVTLIAKNSSIKQDNFSRMALAGFEYDGSGSLSPTPDSALKTYLDSDNNLATNGVSGSDVVSFYFGVEDGTMKLKEDHAGGSSPIKITNNLACMNKDDLLLITNCNQTTIARITNDLTPECSSSETTLEYSASGNSPATIAEPYEARNTWTTHLMQVTYYVADTGRTDASNRPITALFRRANNGAAQEIVEGIESLQFEYGERLPDGNTRFVKASDAGVDMGRVSTIKVGLLVRSNSNVLDSDDEKTYALPGQDIANTGSVAHSGGRVLRRAFVTTVKLRNRN
jgi:type IV pilus assembly protein PilW